ncbi:MAG: ABC transporter ATP-binding protein [Myxococcota bacterium]
MSAVCLSGIRWTTPDGRTVLDGIDLLVPEGAFIAVVGPSGGGKTTLLSILGGLSARFQGHATLFGASLGTLSDDARTRLRLRHVGFVYQSFHLLESWTVEENISVPLWLRGETQPGRVVDVLRRVDMGERRRDRVAALSGGERQRVAIARAVVHDPGLILADEPTGNLDDETGGQVLDLIARLRDEQPGRRIVMATHDPRICERADEVWSLREGKLTRRC